MDIKSLAREVEDKVIAFRRDLHMHPEASFQEFRTTDQIAKALDEMGIPYRRFEPTGLIGEIKGGKPGKTVALRADIDALSITEKTGLDFASQNEGLMHACGHDTHAAMLMGAAMVLNRVKDELCGTVKLLFQPAEEVAGGAKKVIEQGALDGVDYIFGIHIAAKMPVGVVGMRHGASAASADVFRIKVVGKASHGAMPQMGCDATVAAAAIVMNLQTIVSREVDPEKPLVVTVGKLESGSRFNIVSGEANMEGTIRSYDYDLHHSLPDIVKRIAENTAETFRCKAEVEYEMMTEVLVNDAESVELARGAAAKIIDNPAMLIEVPATMGGEDFAEYTPLCKASFAMVGAGGEYPQHSDRVVFDENSFRTGVALYAQVAADYLNG
ncbi:M20 metallopeptidase family protein [Feifania hominis]|uniref:Amidohydrolase n=1 Tax=Feifania hominis TaxID=2763660 RepID=A0A926DES5_9FIRM|nr:amidohydrolase [Feifania hominis]MBC8535979.1 amidohydrolase [Feifania hominis]